MWNLRRPGNPKRYRRKRTIRDLPTEILIMIFKPFFENICTTSRTFRVGLRPNLKWKSHGECTLIDLVLKTRALPRENLAWGLHNCDFTIIDIARVCKLWRDIVMSLTFKQNIDEWDWYDHWEKFKIFQYIETKVYRSQRHKLLNDQADAEEEAREAVEVAKVAAKRATAERAAMVAKNRRRLRLRNLRHRVLRGA